MNLAKHYSSPIINADSRQLYKELPIGTAAPSKKQLQEVTHYFIGTLNLEDYYSAAQYEYDVLQLTNKLFNTHDILLLSGGSMMYIDAVCNGIDDIPMVDDETRTFMQKHLKEKGLETLCEELRVLDPRHYEKIDKRNTKRIVHALEICYMTGKPYSSFLNNTKKERPFNIIKIGLQRPREELYQRINKRVDLMIAQGLEKEAQNVYHKRDYNSLNTVGYKELFNYFDGIWDKDLAIEKIKRSTRIYSRKQMTWFKRDNAIKWFHPNDIKQIIKYIDCN